MRTPSRFTRRLASIAGLIAVAAAAVLGVAAPANAAPQDYCSAGTACVWDDPSYNTNGNYAGLLWFEFSVSNMSNYKYHGTNVSAGDTADSWYNNGNTSTACFYDNASYRGASRCLDKKSGDGNIANNSGIIQGVTWDPNSARFI